MSDDGAGGDDFGDDGFDDDGFDGELFDDEPLDEHETALVRQDLTDLADFRTTFEPEGYRGVSVWCHDCVEEHYFPWDMLKENLQLLLETGETPVHEPAFQPEPDRYVPWDYARGYIDALQDVGVADRLPVDRCNRCGLELAGTEGATGSGAITHANFCPRCGSTLLGARFADALAAAGLDAATVGDILRAVGLPGQVTGPADPA